MGYYDNPDRIMIGVDITTLTDVFEENYREDNGVDFDWKKDGDRFNEASRELDVLIENVFVKMFGQAVAESYDDDTYVLTFWGDRNNPNDIKTLQELQGRADDTWRDNDRVQLAIYDTEFYTGNQSGKFADKWGDIGNALVDAITVGVDFPEEFDSDPNYNRANGMNVRREVNNSRKPVKSDRYQEDVLETYLTPAYAEDRLYDDLYDCQKHNYLVRKYFKEGLRGDDLINAVADSINDDIADWDVTAWHGLEEEGDMFDPQDVYDDMKIQNSRKSSRRPVKSSVEGLTFDNKHNDGSNDFVQYKVNNQKTLDKIKGYLEYNVDELKLGNVYINLMYDNNELVAAQVVDTESSTWDLSPEECIEIFGSDIMTNVYDNVGNHAVDEFTDFDVDPETVKSSRKITNITTSKFHAS